MTSAKRGSLRKLHCLIIVLLLFTLSLFAVPFATCPPCGGRGQTYHFDPPADPWEKCWLCHGRQKVTLTGLLELKLEEAQFTVRTLPPPGLRDGLFLGGILLLVAATVLALAWAPFGK